MPFYDQRCVSCDWTAEVFLRVDEKVQCPTCGESTEHYWKQRASAVVQDEFPEPLGLTLYDQHLINTGRSSEARVMRSHSERRALMKVYGYREVIDHVPDNRDTDKSRHTTNWASGPPPGFDPRPSCMLSPEEQQKRHEEWLASEARFAPIDPKPSTIVLPSGADLDIPEPETPLNFQRALNDLLPQ